MRRRVGSGRYAVFHLLLWVPAGAAFPFFFPLLLRRGLTAAELGLVAAVQAAVALAAQPAAGWLCDRTRRARGVLSALTLGSALLLPLFALVRGVDAECAVAALFTLCNAPVAPLGDALTVAFLRREGGEYGRLRWWGSFGFAAAGVLAGAALAARLLDLRALFALAGALFVAAAAVPLSFPVEVTGLSAAGRPLRALARAHRFLAFLALASAALLPLNATWTYLSVYLQGSLGGGPLAVGASWAIAAATEAPFFFALGGTQRRLGLRGTLLLSFAAGAAGLACIAGARGPALALAGMALQGPAFAIFYGAAVMAVDALAPDGLKASAQSLLWACCFGAGSMVANACSGLLAGRIGVGGMFRVLAAFAVAAGAAFALAQGRLLPPGADGAARR